jgi:hypothetical protein
LEAAQSKHPVNETVQRVLSLVQERDVKDYYERATE